MTICLPLRARQRAHTQVKRPRNFIWALLITRIRSGKFSGSESANGKNGRRLGHQRMAGNLPHLLRIPLTLVMNRYRQAGVPVAMGSHAPVTGVEGPTPALSSQRLPRRGSGSAQQHRMGRVIVLASCLTGYASAFLPSLTPLTPSSSLLSTARMSTRRYFRAPQPIPSVSTLEKNATWSFGTSYHCTCPTPEVIF